MFRAFLERARQNTEGILSTEYLITFEIGGTPWSFALLADVFLKDLLKEKEHALCLLISPFTLALPL